ncbi:MAG: LamG domain-containing protein, partial [Reichenbachiella sp.]
MGHISHRQLLRLFLLTYFLLCCSVRKVLAQQALDLSAAGNRVDIPYDLNVTGAGFTMEAWVQFKTSFPSNYSPFSETTGNAPHPLDLVLINDGGPIYYNLDNGDNTDVQQVATPNQGLNLDQWYHLAITYSPNGTSSESRIYLDGVEIANSTALIEANIGTGGSLMIGDRNGGSSEANMYIDELRIWDDVRDATEILNNKDVVMAGSESNLIIYYAFDGNLTDLAAAGGTTNGTSSGTIGYVGGAPHTVPAPGGVSNNIAYWLKADAEVYTDAGTTPVTNGSPFQQWNDQTSAGLNATQLTGANQPIWTDNALNYNPAISFDGVNDYVGVSFNMGPTSTPNLTTFVVFNSDIADRTDFNKLFGHDN